MFIFLHPHVYTHVCLMPLYYFMQTHKDGFVGWKEGGSLCCGCRGKEKDTIEDN